MDRLHGRLRLLRAGPRRDLGELLPSRGRERPARRSPPLPGSGSTASGTTRSPYHLRQLVKLDRVRASSKRRTRSEPRRQQLRDPVVVDDPVLPARSSSTARRAARCRRGSGGPARGPPSGASPTGGLQAPRVPWMTRGARRRRDHLRLDRDREPASSPRRAGPARAPLRGELSPPWTAAPASRGRGSGVRPAGRARPPSRACLPTIADQGEGLDTHPPPHARTSSSSTSADDASPGSGSRLRPDPRRSSSHVVQPRSFNCHAPGGTSPVALDPCS